MLTREDCLQLDRSLEREWLEVDGQGGYAAGTVPLCATRRYHGLLVAPWAPSGKRHVFLSRFEETLHGADRHFPLSMARYPGTWAPHGHQWQTGFELAPYPRSRYQIGRVGLTREILMLRGAPILLLRYAFDGLDIPLELRLRPLLAFREADALTFENLALDPRVERLPGGIIRCQPYPSLPAIHLSAGEVDAIFEADPVWYRQVEYRADLARGYDGHEDLFSPGTWRLQVPAQREIVVAAAIDGPVADPGLLWAAESARRRASLPEVPDLRSRLRLAADAFDYRSAEGRRGILAGFPWFGEWGRDTFIALPGLSLARGKLEACSEVLCGALPYLRGGLMPNVFGLSPETSAYNSADAALWFALAVDRYALAGGDAALLRERFLPALVEIAERYLEGAAMGLSADASGLLGAGGEGLNATWMDAVTSAGPVTPRDGQPVEINALWYALLGQLEQLHAEAGSPAQADAWRRRRERAGRAFLARFWLPEPEYLADRWVAGAPDRAIRPNMVIAAALARSPLERSMRAGVVRSAEAELLTPRGLRTLAPADPSYRGSYRGGPEARDAAYHQGSAWPWLLGFYVEATLRAFPGNRARAARRRALVEGFGPHLDEAGLNQISEIFDGDPPHRPGGCFAQAWSVAELLRALDLLDAAASSASLEG